MDPLKPETATDDHHPEDTVSDADTENLIIRHAQTSDSVRLAILTKRFFPYIHLSADQIFERIRDGIVYFVLARGDDVLGFIDFELNSEPNPRHATIEKPPLSSPKTAKILGLCVLPELQGKGWGKKLLAAALNESKAMQCRQVVMLVEESNEKAIRIYEQAGFRKHGKLRQKIWEKDVLLYVLAV